MQRKRLLPLNAAGMQAEGRVPRAKRCKPWP